jgi:hypothetical protein
MPGYDVTFMGEVVLYSRLEFVNWIEIEGIICYQKMILLPIMNFG